MKGNGEMDELRALMIAKNLRSAGESWPEVARDMPSVAAVFPGDETYRDYCQLAEAVEGRTDSGLYRDERGDWWIYEPGLPDPRLRPGR